jgi:hypothetical protein
LLLPALLSAGLARFAEANGVTVATIRAAAADGQLNCCAPS